MLCPVRVTIDRSLPPSVQSHRHRGQHCQGQPAAGFRWKWRRHRWCHRSAERPRATIYCQSLLGIQGRVPRLAPLSLCQTQGCALSDQTRRATGNHDVAMMDHGPMAITTASHAILPPSVSTPDTDRTASHKAGDASEPQFGSLRLRRVHHGSGKLGWMNLCGGVCRPQATIQSTPSASQLDVPIVARRAFWCSEAEPE